MLGALEAGNELAAQDKPMYPGGEGDQAYVFPVKESYRLSPLKQIYLITLGTAKQLGLANVVGNFERGKEADFVLIDKDSTPWLRQRLKDIADKYASKSQAGPLSRAEMLNEVGEKLLAVSTLSSDSVIKVSGKSIHTKERISAPNNFERRRSETKGEEKPAALLIHRYRHPSSSIVIHRHHHGSFGWGEGNLRDGHHAVLERVRHGAGHWVRLQG